MEEKAYDVETAEALIVERDRLIRALGADGQDATAIEGECNVIGYVAEDGKDYFITITPA